MEKKIKFKNCVINYQILDKEKFFLEPNILLQLVFHKLIKIFKNEWLEVAGLTLLA